MSIETNIQKIETDLQDFNCKLIVVTKNQPISSLEKVYELGYKIFGENRVQELVEKYEALPKDINWHIIGHLQTNKVKYIAPFISLIQSVESFKLLEEINKQALKCNRIIDCLLQIFIAKEETKFGLSEQEALEILHSGQLSVLQNIKIVGVMGMATNTDDVLVIENEFNKLKIFFDTVKSIAKPNVCIQELSMGMSSDYILAAQLGSTMVRVGSAVFK